MALGGKQTGVLGGELPAQPSNADVLSAVDAANVRSLLTGVTTSAVKQTWGCGHSIHSVNGDALYAACPICYARRAES